MATTEKKQLCDNARKIQDILAQGYYIATWPNSEGKDCYYLVPNGKQPHEGSYLSAKTK